MSITQQTALSVIGRFPLAVETLIKGWTKEGIQDSPLIRDLTSLGSRVQELLDEYCELADEASILPDSRDADRRAESRLNDEAQIKALNAMNSSFRELIRHYDHVVELNLDHPSAFGKVEAFWAQAVETEKVYKETLELLRTFRPKRGGRKFHLESGWYINIAFEAFDFQCRGALLDGLAAWQNAVQRSSTINQEEVVGQAGQAGQARLERPISPVEHLDKDVLAYFKCRVEEASQGRVKDGIAAREAWCRSFSDGKWPDWVRKHLE